MVFFEGIPQLKDRVSFRAECPCAYISDEISLTHHISRRESNRILSSISVASISHPWLI